jgi:Rrf2 family transcriptional repressor of oqxAB
MSADVRFPTALQMVLSVALADHDGFRCTSQTLADGLGTNPSFIRKLLLPLTAEGMLVAAIGKGGGLHLGRPAAEITLRDIYQAVTEQKRVLAARRDIPSRCRISANIGEFFGAVADEAESAMLDALAQRNVADSLAEMLRLDEARLGRLSKNARPAGAADGPPPLGASRRPSSVRSPSRRGQA